MAGISLLPSISCQKNLLLIQSGSSSHDPIPENPQHPLKDSIDSILEKYRKKGLPGVEVVLKNEAGWYRKAVGLAQLENLLPYQAGSPSWYFSISKIFTATLLMQLKESGQIDLDSSAEGYLSPEIASFIPGVRQISVRDLLRHSSGLINLTELPEFQVGQLNHPLKQPGIVEKLKMLQGKPLAFTPGSDFLYSNSNYLLLHCILERVSGQSYETLLRQRILEPLHLQHIYGSLSDSSLPAMGFPDFYFDRYANEQLENCSKWNAALARASEGYGQLAGTGDDAIRFLEALLENKVVSAGSVDEMKTGFSGAGSAEALYGLGLEFYQYDPGSARQFGHEGDGIGCSTQLLYVPANHSFLYINCTAGRQLAGPYLFLITDMKNEICRYVSRWRP